MYAVESLKFIQLTTLPDEKEVLLNLTQIEAVANNRENTSVKMKSGDFYLIKEDFETIVENLEDEDYTM